MAEILVIDDQTRTTELCRRVMPEHTWHGPAQCWEEAREIMRSQGQDVDLVLLDIHFDIPDNLLLGVDEKSSESEVRQARRRQGFEILAALRRSQPDLPVMLMTARDLGLEKAADRHRAEEYTYFLQDEDLDAASLRSQVEGILRARRGTERDGPIYWGRSMGMRRIRQRLITVARGRLPVILGGPTGTGKSLIARHLVHPRSRRKGKFVAVDLATVPPHLIAAHLFGSVRGAYTGSVADRRGAFEEANGGTLFLDEIGNLDESVQKMLLTVLQEGAVVRLGDTKERNVDVKLVVATNENLEEMVRKKRFRADLYMRLNPAATVVLPPLRERRMEIEALVRFALERLSGEQVVQELVNEYLVSVGESLDAGAGRLTIATRKLLADSKPGVVQLLFPDRTLRLLRQHRWPGNLREFMMTVENAVTLTLAEAIGAGQPPGSQKGPSAGRIDVLQVRPKLVRDLLLSVRLEEEIDGDAGWTTELRVRANDSLNKVAVDVERQYFTQLYVQHNGDFEAMSKALLGDGEGARKVQLRFNQLGLKVRELKGRIR